MWDIELMNEKFKLNFFHWQIIKHKISIWLFVKKTKIREKV